MANEASELQTARDAMHRGAWLEAVESFRAFLTAQPEHAAALETREHAFRVYREAADVLGAARVATALALDYADYRGDVAVCNGWLQRAERLLQGGPPSAEYAWLKLTCA